ncbi:MAG: hypothetical protein ACOX5J_17865 [Candidatus Hydrogenedentales bacterium]|jgi:hypothetical protein
MRKQWLRNSVTALALAALSLGAAGCLYEEPDTNRTRLSIRINLMPDDDYAGGITIRFGTGL